MISRMKYLGGMHFLGISPSGHEIHLDSGHHGESTAGPTPMESVLQAAAVCSAMDVVTILEKRRKTISSFELISEGERSDDHPKIFKTLKITYKVNGPKITDEEVERAVQLSQDKYCSVINMLKPTVKVTFCVEVNR